MTTPESTYVISTASERAANRASSSHIAEAVRQRVIVCGGVEKRNKLRRKWYKTEHSLPYFNLYLFTCVRSCAVGARRREVRACVSVCVRCVRRRRWSGRCWCCYDGDLTRSDPYRLIYIHLVYILSCPVCGVRGPFVPSRSVGSSLHSLSFSLSIHQNTIILFIISIFKSLPSLGWDCPLV